MSIEVFIQVFTNITEIMDHLAVAGTAVVAGIWVLVRLNRERTDEAALDMSLASSVLNSDGRALALLTVHLTNKGKTKIEAKTQRNANGYIFDDNYEKLKYPCTLQIRHIESDNAIPPGLLDWFQSSACRNISPNQTDAQINVLLEYENPEKGNEIEFWMEPGEAYHLGVPVFLQPGVYIVKLTFVAAELERYWWDDLIQILAIAPQQERIKDENFWSQVYAFTVPTVATSDL